VGGVRGRLRVWRSGPGDTRCGGGIPVRVRGRRPSPQPAWPVCRPAGGLPLHGVLLVADRGGRRRHRRTCRVWALVCASSSNRQADRVGAAPCLTTAPGMLLAGFGSGELFRAYKPTEVAVGLRTAGSAERRHPAGADMRGLGIALIVMAVLAAAVVWFSAL